MTWEAQDTAMTNAIYNALGNSVSYFSQSDGTLSINAILSLSSNLFGEFGQTAEEVTTARVKTSDVSTPRRGDRITNAAGAVFVVDAVDRLNDVEYSLTLTERDA